MIKKKIMSSVVAYIIPFHYFVFFLVRADRFPLLRESHFPLTWLDFCGRIGETKLMKIGR